MKNNHKKIFDAVQMVREIRDAMYRKSRDPDFDSKNFERIKQKWTDLLEKQRKSISKKVKVN